MSASAAAPATATGSAVALSPISAGLSPSSSSAEPGLLSLSSGVLANPPQQAAATAVLASDAAAAAPPAAATAAAAAAAAATGAGAHDAPGTAAVEAACQLVQPQQQQQQQHQPQQAFLHTVAMQASAIKPKVLKPIRMARGSSAFSTGQPKRPALAQGSSAVQPSNTAQSTQLSLQLPSLVNPPSSLTQPAVTIPHDTQSQPGLVPGRSATQSQLGGNGSSNIQASFLVPLTETSAGDAAAALTETWAGDPTAAAPSRPAAEQPSSADTELRGQTASAMGSALARQPRAVSQIRTTAGGLFATAPGSKATEAVRVSQGIPAASMLHGSRSQPQESDLAAVHRLRAQFTLPFAMAPAEGQASASKAGKRHQVEGEELPDIGKGNEGSQAEGVRAVVDALQAGQPSDETAAAQPVSKKRKGTFGHISAQTMSFGGCFVP